MFKINNRDRACSKKRLSGDFLQLEIPKDASLVGQAVLGSSSVPGEGILVNMWTGELHRKKETGRCASLNNKSIYKRTCLCLNLHFMFVWLCCVILHVMNFCLCREVREHCHWVWMYSCQHPDKQRQKWMAGSQVCKKMYRCVEKQVFKAATVIKESFVCKLTVWSV